MSARKLRWKVPALLFVATTLSVFWAGAAHSPEPVYVTEPTLSAEVEAFFLAGWTFAVPLLAILLAHEFGHYIAARLHRVPASLPYFLPLPVISLFGTLGAIILVPERVRRRDALLDFGAAGPLAGMAVALPLMLVGLSLSTVGPPPPGTYVQEGQSLLYLALKWLVLGPIPEGQDVMLHPTAFAAWVGFLVTFLNLLPFSQLDGGHVAYALFGEKQDRFARWFYLVPLVMVVVNGALALRSYSPEAPAASWLDGAADALAWALERQAVGTWLFLFVMLSVLRWRAGVAHPPTDRLPALGPRRRAVALFTLSLFVLLFMPAPLTFQTSDASPGVRTATR